MSNSSYSLLFSILPVFRDQRNESQMVGYGKPYRVNWSICVVEVEFGLGYTSWILRRCPQVLRKTWLNKGLFAVKWHLFWILWYSLVVTHCMELFLRNESSRLFWSWLSRLMKDIELFLCLCFSLPGTFVSEISSRFSLFMNWQIVY